MPPSGADRSEYESTAVVGADAESAVLQAVGESDTVYVEISEESSPSRTTFDSLARRIARETADNVGLVRNGKAVDPSADDGPDG